MSIFSDERNVEDGHFLQTLNSKNVLSLKNIDALSLSNKITFVKNSYFSLEFYTGYENDQVIAFIYKQVRVRSGKTKHKEFAIEKCFVFHDRYFFEV